MKWKEIENQYEAECSECSNDIDEGVSCYWKREKGQTKGILMCASCYNRFGSNKDKLRIESNRTDTTTTNDPPTVPPFVDRNAAISKGHDENMKSAELNRLALQSLTSAIVDLMRVEADRNALLKKGLEAKA